MKNLIDIHTHTVSSGHAYSTLQENIAEAKKGGLCYYGVSDHTQGVPGGAHHYYFSNLKVLPREVDGVVVLRGAEVNIINSQGELDLDPIGYRPLDYVIASIHTPCFPLSHTPEEITQAYENVCKNPLVVVIGHPDDGRFACDYERLVTVCKENEKLIEINNSSLNPTGFREGCWENSLKILEICKRMNQPIIMSSDAHVSYDIGNIEFSKKIIEESDFPVELIVNYNEELIEKYFFRHQK